LQNNEGKVPDRLQTSTNTLKWTLVFPEILEIDQGRQLAMEKQASEAEYLKHH
jgi:hypothetical protein